MPLPGSTEPESFKAFEERRWDLAAHVYHDAFGPLTRQVAPLLLDAAGVGSGTRLLDVASGPGYVSAAAVARGAEVIGCDLSHEMVALAQRNFPGIDFRVGDAEALAFPDRRFDAVIAAFVLGHVARPAAVLHEARRVLRERGRFALSWWAPRERAVGFQIMQDAVAAKGRSDVPLPPAPALDHFSNALGLRGTLEAVGFAGVDVREHAMTFVLASGEALFEAYLHGTARTGGLLSQQTPEALAAIRADVTDRCRPYLRQGRVELPMAAFIASGRRPADPLAL